MKLFISLLLGFTLTLQVQAGSVAGFGGSTEITQVLNKVILGIQQKIQIATQYATVAMQVKQVITDPMTALFGSNAGKQIENETRKWLAGGANGDPLIITNPEAYIKNTYTNQLRQDIAMLEQSKNMSQATEGIIISLIRQRRAELNPGSPEPKDLAPSIIQNDLCKDNGEALRQVVEQEILSLMDGLEMNAYNARFASRYAHFCEQSVQNNADLQRDLKLISQSGLFFSWDNWLLTTTGGNNDYARTVKTLQEIDKRAQEKAAMAQAEALKGYRSDKKCVEYLKSDDDGNTYSEGNAPCIAWETIKPADTVAELAKQFDVNNLLKPLFSATKEKNLATDALSGIGDVFKGISEVARSVQSVGNQAGQLISSVNTLRGTIGQLTGGSGSGANQTSINYLGGAGTNYANVGSGTYVNRGFVATSTQISDGSTEEELEEARRPLRDLIASHRESLARIPASIGEGESFTNDYQSMLNTVTSCIQQITTNQNYNASIDASSVTNFSNRANERRTTMLLPITSMFSDARTKGQSTGTFLTNTLNVANGAKNISSIINLFQDYQDAITRGIILPRDIDNQITIINQERIPDLTKDMDGTLEPTSQTIKSLVSECQGYLQQVQFRGDNNGQGG